MLITTREMQYANRHNAKAKRSRRDWKANRKDRRQWIFNSMCRERLWYINLDDEWKIFVDLVPINTTKRQTDFMTCDTADLKI